MLEDKTQETTPNIPALARQFLKKKIKQSAFINEVEKLAKNRERSAFYRGIVVSLLFLLLMVILVKIFPGIIAQKY